jgi:hypothetical protein
VIAAAPDLPCPACNMTDEGSAPRMPDGFKIDVEGLLGRQKSEMYQAARALDA